MHAFTKRLQGYGRFGDKLLAHLSPKEARILKKAGGAGTVNPFTGALEYYKGTLGGGGVNPIAGDAMPGGETTPVNGPSTMSTDKPQAKDAFLNLAETWQSNQPQQESGLDPRMLSFAKIMQNTYDMMDPGTEGEMRAEYNEGSKSIENMLKYTQTISQPLYRKLIDAQSPDWNEDKAPGRVDEVLSYMFTRNNDGINAFEHAGGNEAYMQALEEIGVTGEGTSYADRHASNLIKNADALYKVIEENQTSMNAGKVTRPNAGSYKTFGEAREAMFGPTGLGTLAKMLSPTQVLTNLAETGFRAFNDPYRSWSDLIGKSLGFDTDAQAGFRKQDVGKGIEDDTTEDDDGTGYGGGAG